MIRIRHRLAGTGMQGREIQGWSLQSRDKRSMKEIKSKNKSKNVEGLRVRSYQKLRKLAISNSLSSTFRD